MHLILILVLVAPVLAFHASSRAPHTSRLSSPQCNLLDDAGDGDIVAVLELATVTVAALIGAPAAWSLVRRQDGSSIDESSAPTSSPSLPRNALTEKVAIDIDLGPDGQPKGVSRILFKPLLARSEFLVVNLTAPLGLVIEERNSAIVATGALPGYGAFGRVQEGDHIRAVTAYAEVIGDAPMWQQVTSGTPIGDIRLARLIFTTEGASYTDVRDAIASHKDSDGSQKDKGRTPQVTLVLERAVNATSASTPRDGVPQLESLLDVLKGDLSRAAVGEIGSSGKRGLVERARQAFGVDGEAAEDKANGRPRKEDWW